MKDQPKDKKLAVINSLSQVYPPTTMMPLTCFSQKFPLTEQQGMDELSASWTRVTTLPECLLHCNFFLGVVVVNSEIPSQSEKMTRPVRRVHVRFCSYLPRSLPLVPPCNGQLFNSHCWLCTCSGFFNAQWLICCQESGF